MGLVKISLDWPAPPSENFKGAPALGRPLVTAADTARRLNDVACPGIKLDCFC